jgi:phosphomannomutase
MAIVFSLSLSLSAMHGVGGQWIERAFTAFNHPVYGRVPSQLHPDPTFPTVSFPNPEEKGALNKSMEFADQTGATLILANDPDADRLAAAEKVVSSGQWKVFTGNEIGVLLGYWSIMQWKRKTSDTAAVLASIVSSRMLKTVARKEGLQYFDTLTGFKWLGNKAMDLRAAGTPVLFSYEEALGYCIGDVLCDKDGVSGASIFYEMASALSEGWTEESGDVGGGPARTVADLLQSLNDKYGTFVSYNSYVLSYDAAKTNAIFAELRQQSTGSGGYWTHAAGQRIVAITDVTKGYDSTTPDHVCALPATPDSQMIMFEFDNGVSVTLRTSGTEPKIKYYTEIAGQPGQTREELSALLHVFVDALVTEMLQPEKYGLVRV